MNHSITDIIRQRRSVRTFDGNALTDDDKRKLEECLKESDNPFGVQVDFRLLDAKENKLSSPVIVGADTYVAAKVRKEAQFEIAYGYSFEKFCLLSWGAGFGSVMLAATISRKTFEQAMELSEGEIMPLASPVGHIADKMSVREKLMRKGVKADERLPFESLFFEGSFEHGLNAQDAGIFANALEMLRLAPSAVNYQPWRAVLCEGAVHFYKKALKAAPSGSIDIQKVDLGIGLAHFDMTLKEAGVSGHFYTSDPGISSGDSLEYIISYEAND